jgi:hypothetical protein
MLNELVFIGQIFVIASATLVALAVGRSTLVGLICLFCVLSNLFVLKQINLFGFDVTATDAYAVGAIMGLNLLQEYFGQAAAKKAIITNFLIMIVYLVMSQLHLAFTPNGFDSFNNHFTALLNIMPRLIVASTVSYFITQISDAKIYTWLKKLSSGKYLTLRSFFSLSLSQLIDTTTFSFLALYGVVGSIWQVILVSFCVKFFVVVLNSPFVALSKKIVKIDKNESF